MNRYADHVYVIPEDRADQQIAEGFVNHHAVKDSRIKVMPVARGWPNVLKTFEDEYIATLRKYPLAYVVMLIDFDDLVEDRRARFEQAIPDDLKPRVFVIGSRGNPETLKKSLGVGFEEIGNALAGHCEAGTNDFWDHEQLRHNDLERQRLIQSVRNILF